MITVVIVTSLLLVVLMVVAFLYGGVRWRKETDQLRRRLEASRRRMGHTVVDFSEFEELPIPVQRYFRTVLKEGQRAVSSVHLAHEGTFNMGEKKEAWKPFTSDQQIVTKRPGFDWDARIQMWPGLTARVHDCYIAGEGILYGAVAGLIPVVDLRGSGEIALGELMRFLAEAAWYPTALLPSQGVTWKSIDSCSAAATLSDNSLSVTLIFSFSDEGVIETVQAEARGRQVGNDIIPTRWQGRFWNYQPRAGMRIPLNGEVAWVLSQKVEPYWRGQIMRIEYEFAE